MSDAKVRTYRKEKTAVRRTKKHGERAGEKGAHVRRDAAVQLLQVFDQVLLLVSGTCAAICYRRQQDELAFYLVSDGRIFFVHVD